MRVTMRMPIKKQYNLVTNDELDTRVPLHPDEAFTHGIKFSSKYIGTLDVPRPTSRVEIVAAMRRIRYEFKAKGIKKKKVSLEISLDGVKISLRKKKKQQITDDSQLLLMSHPIYRIFYVSHDSQDLKIFSYIARDASSNVFRCHVFKANKKNQAMRVVRTIGQAFEVCHKMAVKDKSPSPDIHADDISREGSEDSSDKPKKDGQDSESGQEDLITLPSDSYNDDPSENVPLRPIKLEPLPPPIGSDALKKGETFASPLSELLSSGDYLPQAGTPLSVHHELQLLREQLEQQQQQTQAAVAQVHLLRDQLAAETAARLEAQARTHQLLVHNKDLLEHIQQLVLQVRDMEIKLHGGGGVSGSLQMPPIPPDVKSDLSSYTPGTPSWLTQHQRQLSHQLSTSLPDTPPTPSPTMGTQTFRFPSSFHSTSPLATFSHSSSPLSPLISPLFMASGDIILPVPHQESQLQRQQQYLQEQQQRLQQQLWQRDFPAHLQQKIGLQQSHVRGDDGSCSTLYCGDGDHKRDACGGQSPSESVAGAMSHLYNTDYKRLAQVPEDGVPMTQFGNTLSTGAESLLSSQRSPSNGPITRAASERYSRQETLAQMQRMAWARHTTK